MPSRKEMEDREARELAPYAKRSRETRGRAHPEPEHPLRPAYQRDRERIIHSRAFRRLQYKTQVFVNHEGDHFRTRLTHTMEVAQISRAIARILNVNEDLTEAIALAHDLGHTPFGHSGEDALRELMRDHGGFEHNIHGLRVVDVLEHQYPGFQGLNLTWELRESIAKHTTVYDNPTVVEFEPELRPLVEAQIVEVADGIAYSSHDLDDALAAGILKESIYDEIPLLVQVSQEVSSRHPKLDMRQRRQEIVRALINLFVTDICRTTEARIERMGLDSSDKVRHAPENAVCFSEDLGRMKKELQDYLFENVYQHYRVARMAHRAKRFITEIFTAFVDQPRQLPPYYQRWAKEQGLYQGVSDYIAGMTDRYAQDEYMKLFKPFQPV